MKNTTMRIELPSLEKAIYLTPVPEDLNLVEVKARDEAQLHAVLNTLELYGAAIPGVDDATQPSYLASRDGRTVNKSGAYYRMYLSRQDVALWLQAEVLNFL